MHRSKFAHERWMIENQSCYFDCLLVTGQMDLQLIKIDAEEKLKYNVELGSRATEFV